MTQPDLSRWIDPELSRIVAAWPPDAWPLRLFRPDGTPVIFDSPDDVRTATLPPEYDDPALEPLDIYAPFA